MLWDIHSKKPDLRVISDASGSWGCRVVAATRAGTAMAVLVFVSTEKKKYLRAIAYES